jgi:hypothetical protein
MTSPQKSQRWSLTLKQFLHPKSGNSVSECEDAIGFDLGVNRFAVADGATEAFDARTWAEQLVTSWIAKEDCLRPAQFWTFVEEQGRILSASWSKLELPWYSEEKAGTGSFAAFVGVQIDLNSEVGGWQAIALGDSCLVQFRTNKIVKALPVAKSDQFSATPVLAPSNTSLQPEVVFQIAFDKGQLENGDLLLLLSDAVAAWFLRLAEDNDRASLSEFVNLLDRADDPALARFFETERILKRMKDDDIAVLGIRVVRV